MPRKHRKITDGCGEPRSRRAKFYDAAYRAGLKGAKADDWVDQQLRPRPRAIEQTPTLFGGFIAKDSLARQKGEVR